MKLRWMSVLSVFGILLWHGLTGSAQAQSTSSNSTPSVEERLSAIEGKLRSLESRIDRVLGKGEQKSSQEESSAELPLPERIESLDQKLRIIERRRELDEESVAAKVKENPIVTANGKDGFGFRSADSNFQLKISGYAQADSRFFVDDSQKLGTSTFVLRRVRPLFEGTVYKYFDFRMMPDFGNGQTVLQDMHLDFNYLPGAKIRFGKFKAPVGLERLQAARDIEFVERGFPTDLVPNRDLGVQLMGDNLAGGIFNYAVGIYNGLPDGASGDVDTNNTKDFGGRVFVHPFRKTNVAGLQGLGVGLSGTKGSQQGALPTLKTSGQSTFFSYGSGVVASGDLHRLSPQAYYYWGPLGLLAEYVQSVQDVKRSTTSGEIKNQAWQVEGTFVLTGEKASYKAVTPKKAFDPTNGSFGALELTGRYGRLNIDNDAFIFKFADPTKSASEANAWLVGLNWYFARNLKFVVNYEQTHFRGGGPTGDRETEKVVLSRFQIGF
jgi:phosphate-selective porin OprO/OprP